MPDISVSQPRDLDGKYGHKPHAEALDLPDPRSFDQVVPEGEAYIGRFEIAQHIVGGQLHLGERVNVELDGQEFSGTLRTNASRDVFVETDDGERALIFSYTFNNLTPHGLAGFRYQRAESDIEADAARAEEAALDAHYDFLAGA